MGSREQGLRLSCLDGSRDRAIFMEMEVGTGHGSQGETEGGGFLLGHLGGYGTQKGGMAAAEG